MFGIRTPVSKVVIGNSPPKNAEDKAEKTGPPSNQDRTFVVRRSIGEIEARATKTSPKREVVPVAGPSRPKTRVSTDASDASASKTAYPPSRVAEARACLNKAKLCLSSSRNIKTEYKEGITAAVERLYQLVKESEAKEVARIQSKGRDEKKGEDTLHPPLPAHPATSKENDEMLRKMEEHSKLILENTARMESLKKTLDNHQKVLEAPPTYANIVAGSPRRPSVESTAMHSVVITSKDDQDTGEEVYDRVRRALNAKDEGTRIDKIRKAKDQKVILSCKDKAELKKVKERLIEKGCSLKVEDIKNKDPLLVLYGVRKENTDEDIVKAIRGQNGNILRDVDGEDFRVEVRYRRRARNPLTVHVVVRVSPAVWQRLTGAGAVHIDIQRVRVADQSPLIQCSRCLGYGHGKKFCQDAIDVCSHCGGPHLRTECADWLVNAPPSCVNCNKAKIEKADHDAFSDGCPVRRKWDALARSTTAYS